MEKSTFELENELSGCSSLENYFQTNDKIFNNTTLSEMLLKLLDEKSFTKAQIIRLSGLNEIYAYQVFSGKRRPSRDKLIALCLSMKLNLHEMQGLLKLCEYPLLYAKNKRDSIIIFSINHENTIGELNELLFEQSFDIIT